MLSFRLARTMRLSQGTGGQWRMMKVPVQLQLGLVSESEDSRTVEKQVACNGPQEDGRIVRDQDQLPEEHVRIHEDGKLMYRCQGATKNQGRRSIPFLLGRLKWVHRRPLRKLLDRVQRWI